MKLTLTFVKSGIEYSLSRSVGTSQDRLIEAVRLFDRVLGGILTMTDSASVPQIAQRLAATAAYHNEAFDYRLTIDGEPEELEQAARAAEFVPF